MVVKVTPPGWIPLYPGVTLASESRSARERFNLSERELKKKKKKKQLLLQSPKAAFISVQFVFIIHDCSISVPSLSLGRLTLLIQTPRKRRLVIYLSK